MDDGQTADSSSQTVTGSVQHNLVGAQIAQNVARAFIQKIQIKVVIGQARSQVGNAGQLGLQTGAGVFKGSNLGAQFDAAEFAMFAHDGGKGEIAANTDGCH